MVEGMLTTLPRFPCANDKHPLIRWTKGARSDVDDTNWPLIGIPTGSVSGFDCLDVDVEGLRWLAQVKLPPTRTHSTRSGGRHLLFKHVEGLRCSASRIADGVDVRADGGYIIYWPRQGLPFDDRPIADWPSWLLAKALKPLAPWVSDGEGQGIDGNPHAGGPSHGASGVADNAKPHATLNFRARCKSIIRQVEHAKRGERNRLLNWSAYRFGGMVAEGLINPDIAALLLEQGAKVCGLWHDDGPAQCRSTIKSGIAAGVRDAKEACDGID
jgi:Bifunctional DNA primase/polymerase, N-terminal